MEKWFQVKNSILLVNLDLKVNLVLARPSLKEMEGNVAFFPPQNHNFL